MEKILFVTTVEVTVKAFLLPYLKLFQDQGFEVHVACNGQSELPYCDQRFNLPFQRSPFRKENLNAYRQLKQIIADNHYSLIHCHTPIAGALTRLAAKPARKTGTAVLYTAHGFHFYKGAPLKNWLVYYPVEKILARDTDCLITINEEDYSLAKRKLHAKRIEKVDGVGIDLEQFHPVSDKEKQTLRQKLDFQTNDFILFFAAEFNANKNQLALLPVAHKLKDEIPNLKIVLAGNGPLLQTMKDQIAEDHLEAYFALLGYRTDIPDLVHASDILISTSKREGLPVNLMEGLACGKPVVATDVRGNRDLIQDQETGFLVPVSDIAAMASPILQLQSSPQLYKKLSIHAAKSAQAYSMDRVLRQYGRLYQGFRLQDKL